MRSYDKLDLKQLADDSNHFNKLFGASHRRQAVARAAAVRLVDQPRIADHQHAAIGLRADQPAGTLLER